MLAGATAVADPALLGDVLARVNAARAASGLAPLAGDARLGELSQHYADVMAGSSCLAHDCGGLGRVGERAARAGLAYQLVGEALAGGPPEPGALIELWLASPSHRAILLHPEVTTAGVGHGFRGGADPAGFGHYWVLTVSLQE